MQNLLNKTFGLLNQPPYLLNAGLYLVNPVQDLIHESFDLLVLFSKYLALFTKIYNAPDLLNARLYANVHAAKSLIKCRARVLRSYRYRYGMRFRADL